MYVDSSEILNIGDTGASAQVHTVATSGTYTFNVNATAEFTLSATLADFADNEIRTTGFYSFGSAAGVATMRSGTGSPESAVSANDGSIFLRTDGTGATGLYYKENGTGNTGWLPMAPWTQSITVGPISANTITIPSTAVSPIVIVSINNSGGAGTVNTINTNVIGQIIVITGATSADDITFTDGSPLRLAGGNFVTSDPDDKLVLLAVASNTWAELGRNDNT
jgi:hypothetical protein